MKDLTVIILTYNESIHIERCVKSLQLIAKDIFIVDSFSTDDTLELATNLGVKVYQNEWVNYSRQFQWALDNCPIETEWIMRMDADEYIESKLGDHILNNLNKVNKNVNGVYLKRKYIFMDRWIKYGGMYPLILMRIWRRGYGRIEQRWMDEHIVLESGDTVLFEEGDIVDDNKNTISWWISKHNNYATREMIDLLNMKYGFIDDDKGLIANDNRQAKIKRLIKEKIYSKMPLGLRSSLYFVYRYIFRLGFLDGRQGFIFHFMQGWWYRFVVDIKVMEVRSRIKNEDGNIKKIIKDIYRIDM